MITDRVVYVYQHPGSSLLFDTVHEAFDAHLPQMSKPTVSSPAKHVPFLPLPFTQLLLIQNQLAYFSAE